MKFLFINVPSRRKVSHNEIPLGLLYAGSALERAGHIVKILDLYLDDPLVKKFDSGDYSRIYEYLDEFKPDVIGFGGIASSYGRTKILSECIYRYNWHILQIAGGPLASVRELLLAKTHVSVIFRGEAEQTLPEFFNNMYEPGDENRYDIAGKQTLILDDISIPNYDLLELSNYNITNLPIMASRGCTGRCSFCYRHMKGHRQHSVGYVINHLKYVIRKFGIRTFTFNDEQFNANRQWVWDFCDAVVAEKLGITFSCSMRADRIDRDLLKRMKEAGCTEIAYGQESFSDTILMEYRKGISPIRNRFATEATREAGIACPVQIVIGSPSETEQTIQETTDQLVAMKGNAPLSINYLIPYPEAPVWKYVEERNLIPDVEAYLDKVAQYGGAPIVNLTSVPDNIWSSWSYQIKSDVQYARDGKALSRLVSRCVIAGYRIVPGELIWCLRRMRVYG